MHLKRAYYAHCIKEDRFIYIIGGRGDTCATSQHQFVKSQSTVERYCMKENKWQIVKVRLNEGRYHASACIVNERFIYVFGGYRTKKLQGDYTTSKINRNNETMVNVTSGRIECFDTSKALEIKSNVKKGQFPQTSSGTDEDAVKDMIDNMELWQTFDVINIKRDPVNNVGQLVVFPLSSYWEVRKKAIQEEQKDKKEEESKQLPQPQPQP